MGLETSVSQTNAAELSQTQFPVFLVGLSLTLDGLSACGYDVYDGDDVPEIV